MMYLTKSITISVIILLSMSCTAKEDSINSEAAQLIENNLTEMLPAESKLLSVEETDMDGFFDDYGHKDCYSQDRTITPDPYRNYRC